MSEAHLSTTPAKAESGLPDVGPHPVLHVVRGVVVAGYQQGRLLGFPTANVPVEGAQVPDGVWAGTVDLLEWPEFEAVPAAISVGNRPTYDSADGRVLEAHLLEFDGLLYGTPIEVRIHALVRQQRKFDSVVELAQQIGEDVEWVRRWHLDQRLRNPTAVEARPRRG